jgi:hypothetical protein
MQTTLLNSLPALGAFVLRLLAALVVLLIGWLIAKWLAGLVGKLLKRLGVDERAAKWAGDEKVPKVEEGIKKIVFYILMLVVLLAFFEVLGLTFITQPLNAFLDAIAAYIPNLLAAGVLILAAWIVATILRGLVRRILQMANVDKRLGEDIDPEKASVSKALSEAVYWLVWLVFLVPILEALGLQNLVIPLTNMWNQVAAFLPKLFAAVLILLVGWFVAKIVRRIVTGFLAAVGVDRFSDRVGLGKVLGKQNLSGLIGLIVFVLILIPVIMAALEAVGLTSLTAPLTAMLASVFTAIPVILAAFVVLLVAAIVGRLVGDLVANLLEGIGFDKVMVYLGLAKEPTTGRMSPSKIVGYIVFVAIMLLAVMAATSLVNIPALSVIVAQFIAFAWHILVGLVIFGLGLWLASVLAKAVDATDWPNKRLASVFARVAVIGLATAMALAQMGLADSIINLAFGLIVGAAALAVALAFGLGGREVAGRELDNWVGAVKELPDTPSAPEANLEDARPEM